MLPARKSSCPFSSYSEVKCHFWLEIVEFCLAQWSFEFGQTLAITFFVVKYTVQ